MSTLIERLADTLERLAGLPLPEDAPDFHLRNKDKTLPVGLQVYAIKREDIRDARKLLLEARYPVAENVSSGAFATVLRDEELLKVHHLRELRVGDTVTLWPKKAKSLDEPPENVSAKGITVEEDGLIRVKRNGKLRTITLSQMQEGDVLTPIYTGLKKPEVKSVRLTRKQCEAEGFKMPPPAKKRTRK